ncbi:MAG: pilus assembly protein PilP [Gammaproteobacteria bacterium]
MKSILAKLWIAIIVVLLTAGCGSSDELAELNRYVRDVKERKPAKIEPAPSFKQYPKYTYPQEERRNPFAATKPTQLATNTNNDTQPDLQRPKEPLEIFPLDALKMVGTLIEGEKVWALITTPDGNVVRVTVGNYLGKNYGHVDLITTKQIELTETLPDGDGWRKQKNSIILVEDE